VPTAAALGLLISVTGDVGGNRVDPQFEASLDHFLDRDLVGRDAHKLVGRHQLRVKERRAGTDRNLAWSVGP
jgi:hypothetical protein